MSSGSEQLQTVSNELIDLKRTMQTLEIELQSQLSMVRYILYYFTVEGDFFLNSEHQSNCDCLPVEISPGVHVS